MDQPVICFTAVFLKGQQGYVGFVEELLQGKDVVREQFHIPVPGP